MAELRLIWQNACQKYISEHLEIFQRLSAPPPRVIARLSASRSPQIAPRSGSLLIFGIPKKAVKISIPLEAYEPVHQLSRNIVFHCSLFSQFGILILSLTNQPLT